MKRLTIFVMGVLLAIGVTAIAATGGKFGMQSVSLDTLISGENQTLDFLTAIPACSPQYYSSIGDKSVKASAGVLCGFLAANGTTQVTIYDNSGGTCNTGGTQKSGTITLASGYTAAPMTLSSGICVAMAGTVGVTVLAK